MLSIRIAGDVAGHEFHGNQYTDVYHGTSEESAQAILKDGLTNPSVRRGDKNPATYVWVTKDRATAEKYAREAGGVPSVLRIRIPGEHAASLKEISKDRVSFPQAIPAKWIRTASAINFTPRDLASLLLTAKRNVMRRRMLWDLPGHEFHGNQWTMEAGEKAAAERLGLPAKYSGSHSREKLRSYSIDNPLPRAKEVDHADIVKIFDETKNRRGETREMNVADLRSPQDYVRPAAVEGYKTKEWMTHNPLVATVNGEHVILNGTHNVLAAHLRGDKKIKVDYLGDVKKLRDAARHPESAIHTAADRHVQPLTLAVMYAFLMAKRAYKNGEDAAIKALRTALSRSLPPALHKAMVAGGEVAVRGLRTLGDVEGHPFHGNQWTSGDGGVLYHGTSSKLVSSIKEKGIIAGHTKRKGETGTQNVDKIADRDKSVYLARTERQARDYADVSAYAHGGHPVVVEVHVPKEHAAHFTKDEQDLKYDSLRYPKDIPSSWIKGHRALGATSFRTLKPPLRKKIGPLNLQFDAQNARAAKWAIEHAAWLIDSITKTTREKIQEAVARAQIDGDLDAQYDSILEVIGDEARATMIARTESMTAANEGQRQGWEQAVEEGLLPADVKRQWIATDVGACPICEELDGTEVAMDEEFGDGFMSPPAHPSCRCTEGLAF